MNIVDMNTLIMIPETGSSFAQALGLKTPALIPVGNKTIIEYTIEDLCNAGIRQLNITTENTIILEMLSKVIGNGSRWGININYSLLENLICNTDNNLIEDARTLVIRGDMLRNTNFQNFINAALKIDCDAIEAHADGQLLDITLLKNEKLLYLWLARTLEPVNMIIGKAYIRDIKNGREFLKAHHDFISGKINNRHYMHDKPTKNVVINGDARVSSYTCQGEYIYVGSKVRIHNTAKILDSSFIHASSNIAANTTVHNSIILGNTYIGDNLDIKDKIIYGNKLVDINNGVCMEIIDKHICRSLID